MKEGKQSSSNDCRHLILSRIIFIKINLVFNQKGSFWFNYKILGLGFKKTKVLTLISKKSTRVKFGQPHVKPIKIKFLGYLLVKNHILKWKYPSCLTIFFNTKIFDLFSKKKIINVLIRIPNGGSFDGHSSDSEKSQGERNIIKYSWKY